MAAFDVTLSVRPWVRREWALAWDADVLAAQRGVQTRVERTEINRALEGARRDWAVQPEATSWLSMSEAERAQIRPRRRRTAAGSLVLVRGEGRSSAPVGAVA